MTEFAYRVDGTVDPTVAAAAPERRAIELSRPQWAALNATERYVSLEGAYRSGKTTIALLKVGIWCWEYPGIPWLLARWTEDNAFSQLKPDFLELWGDRVHRWLPDESCYLIHSKNPDVFSRVYITGLKPQEGTSPFSKIHGKKFACAVIDQPEELSELYFDHLHTRLSAPGFPQQLIVCPNPQIKTHWLSTAFPEDNSRRSEGYRLIKFRMRDNVRALGEDYVAGRERELKKKPAEYRRALLGERGLPMAGKPVYGQVFDRERHVEPVEFNPDVPLIESWDFGRAAVTWTQYPMGSMFVLGGIMGIDVPLQRFIPEVLALRAEWFPNLDRHMLWWVGDPAGHAKNSHGTQSAFDMLSDFDIHIRHTPEANTPQAQDTAIKVITGYLDRCLYDGTPTFRLNPRFRIVSFTEAPREDALLVDGFEVGLCWDDDRSYVNTQYPSITPWKRDPWFSHAFITLHYSAMVHAPRDAAEQIGVLHNPDALRRAKQVLAATTVDDRATGGRRSLTDAEIAAVVGGRDQRRILEARLENQRLKAEWKALRRAQRDPGEPFRWDRGHDSVRRGGY